jgi:hypothetical protein
MNTILLSENKKSIRNKGLYIRFDTIKSISIVLIAKLDNKPIEALLRILGYI